MSSVVEPIASFPNSLAVRANVVHETAPQARHIGTESDSRPWAGRPGGHANVAANSDLDDREKGFVLGEG